MIHTAGLLHLFIVIMSWPRRPRLSLPPELFCESAAGGIHDARANPRQDPRAWEQKTP